MMNRTHLFLLTLILNLSFFDLWAKDVKEVGKAKETIIKHGSYKEAESDSGNFLKFTGNSTKFKIFTTDFTGYVKDYRVNYIKNNNALSHIVVTIVAKEIDTDNDSRNSKMYEKCLLVEQYQTITAKILSDIVLQEVTDKEVEVELKIKDKAIVRKLNYTLSKNEGGYQVSFKTDFSFIEAGIADPSIAIAKVAEMFTIEGAIHFPN